jgi:hypothetical protein
VILGMFVGSADEEDPPPEEGPPPPVISVTPVSFTPMAALMQAQAEKGKGLIIRALLLG